MLGDLPLDGTVLRASSELLDHGARTAVARGEVRHRCGRLLAVATVATVATSYAPGVPELDEQAEPAGVPAGHLLEAVGGAPDDRSCLRVPPGPFLTNATGRGHGGVVAALSAVAAQHAVTMAATVTATEAS